MLVRSLVVVVQLRNKFANLRTQFTREKRKIKQKSGAGPDYIYQPRWVHFERLLFLNGGCVSLHSISNEHTDEEVELIEHNPDAIQDDELGRGDQGVESDRVSTYSRDTEGALDYSRPSRPAAPRTAAGKRKTDEEWEQCKRMFASAVSTLERSNKLAEEDECDAFGHFIAHTLRNMSPGPERQLAMLEIHKAAVNHTLSLSHGGSIRR
ncbi:hypothetical protein MTO96_050819 [Rhipicephalus appendiculatus]